jgi:hypothetical protein
MKTSIDVDPLIYAVAFLFVVLGIGGCNLLFSHGDAMRIKAEAEAFRITNAPPSR